MNKIILFALIFTPAMAMPSWLSWRPFLFGGSAAACITYCCLKLRSMIWTSQPTEPKRVTSLEVLWQNRVNGVKPSMLKFKKPDPKNNQAASGSFGVINSAVLGQAASGRSDDHFGADLNELSNRYLAVKDEYEEVLKSAEKHKTASLWLRVEEIAKKKKNIGYQMNSALKELDRSRRRIAEQQEIPRPAWVVAHEEKYADVYARRRALKAARERAC